MTLRFALIALPNVLVFSAFADTAEYESLSSPFDKDRFVFDQSHRRRTVQFLAYAFGIGGVIGALVTSISKTKYFTKNVFISNFIIYLTYLLIYYPLFDACCQLLVACIGKTTS